MNRTIQQPQVTYEKRMERLQQVHSQNVERARRGFTGQVVWNWYEGEVKSEEVKTVKRLAE